MAVFRIEKTRDYTVMANHHLKNKNLSLKAKGLLSVILSLPEDWNYTTRGLACICKEGVDCISATLSELEQNGYLVRNRLRDDKGRITDTEYVIYEKPANTAQATLPDADASPDLPPSMARPHTEQPTKAAPYTENPYMDEPNTDNPAQLNTKELNTNPVSINQTTTSIHPSIHVSHPSTQRNGSDGLDGLDMVKEYRLRVRCNIEYFELSETYHSRIQQLDEIVDIMVETLCSTRPTIAVAGDELPTTLVKERLLKLNSSHIEYVMDCLKNNTSEIRNIKRYLLTVLFNAPATMDNYYTSMFQHDYYGGGSAGRSSM